MVGLLPDGWYLLAIEDLEEKNAQQRRFQQATIVVCEGTYENTSFVELLQIEPQYDELAADLYTAVDQNSLRDSIGHRFMGKVRSKGCDNYLDTVVSCDEFLE